MSFLQKNASSERVVIYASLPHVLIHAALAPLKQIVQLDHRDLNSDLILPDSSWHIEHSWGGGQPERVRLAPPFTHSKTLKNGEKLVFRRSWAGSKLSPVELSQKLVHSLDLHYVEERNAYCRVDENGDIEDVFDVLDVPSEDFGESIAVVTVKASDFYKYVCLVGMGVVFFFDFTRFKPKSFPGWSNLERFERNEQHLFYHGGVQAGVGSYLNGRQIVVPSLTKREILRQYKLQRDPRKQQYATFKALDLKTGNKIEASCDPAKLSSYFDTNSDHPLQMSPAFFRAEVLHKYKADPAKYELSDRDIHCRGAWHLQTYDVNDAGQVHTYLRYLSYLPYTEQLYWQSFNEWPKGFVSKRALKTDFLGEWSTDYDPLREIKQKIDLLNARQKSWWARRDKALVQRVLYPVTNSSAEWADAILHLDQLVVEGFQDKALRKIATDLGRTVEAAWRSLKLLEVCLVALNVPEIDARSSIDALRKIHELRTTVKGHAAPTKKAKEEKSALTRYGSFRAHFEAISADCDNALGLIAASPLITIN